MVRHYLKLNGARTLPTESLALVERTVQDIIDARATGAVHGPAGLGKTFAVEKALELRSGLAVYWATFPTRPTMRALAETLLTELTGVEDKRSNRFTLTGQLLVELAAPAQVLLVIDEAQQLNGDCIEFLRHLHDHRLTEFALLLVGGDGTWRVLSREPMLASRIYRRVAFRPLTTEQTCTLIPTYHPIYDGVDGELVTFINDRVAHGNMRAWAKFTKTAADLCRESGRKRVDRAVAKNAFTLGGGRTR